MTTTNPPDGLVLVFPGQGLQYVGMGQSLANAFPVARRVFEEADDILGFALSRVAWRGPSEELTRTRHAQPAILAHSLAAHAVLREISGVEPVAAAGHSLGEWSALVAAGALRFADALRLVYERGRFMEEALPVGAGGMLAVLGADLDVVAGVCRDAAFDSVLAIATHNGPGHFVIAGHRDALARAAELALARGASAAQEVQVSTPFHCDLMAPAADRLAQVLVGVPIHVCEFPVRSTIVDEWLTGDIGDRLPALLVKQLTSPVLWRQAVEGLCLGGATRGLALGPAKSMIGMVKRISRRLPLTLLAEDLDFAPEVGRG